MDECQSIFAISDRSILRKSLIERMRLSLCLKLLLASAATLVMSTNIAAPIEFDGAILEIPNPKGFTSITPKMTAIYDFQTKHWPESAVHFLTFIQDDEIPIALRNEIPDMNRRMVVTTVKEVLGKTVRTSDFEEMKKIIKNKSEKITEQVNKAISDEIEKQSKRIYGKSDASAKMDMRQVIQYPYHDESDRSIATSMLTSYMQSGIDGRQISNTVAVTSTYLHLRGKLLILYTYGEESALGWTRSSSKQWAEAILAANPPDAKSSVAESGRSSVRDIDWIRAAVIGLLTAGLWGGIDALWKKYSARSKKT